MKEKLKTFWTWVKETLRPEYQTEIEAYLNQAIDHADLERRMHYIMRRGFL